MYCGKCGAQQADDAAFCSECGAKLQTTSQSANPVPEADVNTAAPMPVQQKQKNRIIGIAAVAVLVIVVIVLGVLIFGGRSYKSAVKQFMKGTFEGDAKAIMKVLPKDYLNVMMEEEGYDSKKEAQEDLQKQLDRTIKLLNQQFDDWKYSYEITETEDYSKKDLKDLNEDLEEYGIQAKAAKDVTVDVTLKSKDGKETNDQEVTVIKIGGSWYLWMD